MNSDIHTSTKNVPVGPTWALGTLMRGGNSHSLGLFAPRAAYLVLGLSSSTEVRGAKLSSALDFLRPDVLGFVEVNSTYW